MSKYSKETVLKMADMLGYTLTQNRCAVYLIKGEERIYKNGFAKAYRFLYNKKKDIGIVV